MSNVQAAAQLADSIVQATAVTHNPSATPQQRAEAVQFFEQVRNPSYIKWLYNATKHCMPLIVRPKH